MPIDHHCATRHGNVRNGLAIHGAQAFGTATQAARNHASAEITDSRVVPALEAQWFLCATENRRVQFRRNDRFVATLPDFSKLQWERHVAIANRSEIQTRVENLQGEP